MAFKLLHVVGARPQFPKVAAVVRAAAALRRDGLSISERVIHTGQHYDHGMSAVFFEELGLREPDVNLGVGSGNHAYQTSSTLTGIYQALGDWPTDAVVVYGDTNATLGGGLAALQRRLPLAHVEAGVRTGNMHHAEELNRVVTDRIATWRFCCTEHNLESLCKEGLDAGSSFTGDTMLDNYRHFLPRMNRSLVTRLGLDQQPYILCTIHRAENTDFPGRMQLLLDTLLRVQRELMPVVLPLHPRTRAAIADLDRGGELEAAGVRVLEPLGFHATQALLEHCQLLFSDSGGMLREAYFAGRYCVIPWEYAAWPELVEAGWADAGPVEPDAILSRLARAPGPRPAMVDGLFGDGNAGAKILKLLIDGLG